MLQLSLVLLLLPSQLGASDDGARASPRASPLGLAWGVVSEPVRGGSIPPGRVAEHLEFLQTHGWKAVRLSELASSDQSAQQVVLSFDDPVSAARYVLPLLELYRVPAIVTVGQAQGADPTVTPALALLARSPWIELVPRVDLAPGVAANGGLEVRCDPPAAGSLSEMNGLTELRAELAGQLERLRAVSGATPTAVAWAPGAWSGSAEAVAVSLGLGTHLPSFSTIPPPLASPRVARYSIATWAGIWAIVQAGARWDPDLHPIRFVEIDAAWLCAGGDPEARLRRITAVVRNLGLNGVRLVPGDLTGAWFPTTAAPVRGDVVGPLSRALRAAGVRWIAVDVPETGDTGRDIALASDLARAVDLDVVLLPAGAQESDRLGEAILYARPAARLGWRGAAGPGDRSFRLTPFAPHQQASCGATVVASDVARANHQGVDLALAGCEWVGLPIELAETGLRDSLSSLAAFALPSAGKHTER